MRSGAALKIPTQILNTFAVKIGESANVFSAS